MNRLKLLLPVFALLVAACAGGLPEVTPDAQRVFAARWPDAGPESLNSGRALFIQRCSGCHALPSPAKHDESGWQHTLTVMGGKAHLDPAGREAVLRYLTLASDMRRAALSPRKDVAAQTAE